MQFSGLKTLFYLIMQCTSDPCLEISLCRLGKELEAEILNLYSQEAALFIKVIIMCANIKIVDFLVCFLYILNQFEDPQFGPRSDVEG